LFAQGDGGGYVVVCGGMGYTKTYKINQYEKKNMKNMKRNMTKMTHQY
jgi:hypothetical protein